MQKVKGQDHTRLKTDSEAGASIILSPLGLLTVPVYNYRRVTDGLRVTKSIFFHTYLAERWLPEVSRISSKVHESLVTRWPWRQCTYFRTADAVLGRWSAREGRHLAVKCTDETHCLCVTRRCPESKYSPSSTSLVFLCRRSRASLEIPNKPAKHSTVLSFYVTRWIILTL